MFSAYLNDRSAWECLLSQPVMRTSLEWLGRTAADAAVGDYPLGEPDWYANVHGYDTLPVSACTWESHRETVDVQYIIAGGESIRWLPDSALGEPVRTRKDRDRLDWHPPAQVVSTLAMRAGMFAVFLPREAHCPKIILDATMPIRKAVVKIPIRLLQA